MVRLRRFMREFFDKVQIMALLGNEQNPFHIRIQILPISNTYVEIPSPFIFVICLHDPHRMLSGRTNPHYACFLHRLLLLPSQLHTAGM